MKAPQKNESGYFRRMASCACRLGPRDGRMRVTAPFSRDPTDALAEVSGSRGVLSQLAGNLSTVGPPMKWLKTTLLVCSTAAAAALLTLYASQRPASDHPRLDGLRGKI